MTEIYKMNESLQYKAKLIQENEKLLRELLEK